MVTETMPMLLIRHRGFFNFAELQRAMRQWFIDEEFNMVDIPGYQQKFATPVGVEHEYKIKAYKNVTEYVRFHFNVFVRVYDLRDIEIIRDGKKVKLQDGKIMIRVTPTLEFDWQKRFGGSKFIKALDEFLRKYVLRYKIADYWEDMIAEKQNEYGRFLRQKLGQEVM